MTGLTHLVEVGVAFPTKDEALVALSEAMTCGATWHTAPRLLEAPDGASWGWWGVAERGTLPDAWGENELGEIP